jgi:hypothetical protein
MEAHCQAELTFWRVAKLLPNTNPHQVYPSKTELIQDTAFGKPHPCHSYTVTPAIQHLLIILLKFNLLEEQDAKNFSLTMKNGDIIPNIGIVPISIVTADHKNPDYITMAP